MLMLGCICEIRCVMIEFCMLFVMVRLLLVVSIV